MDNFQTALAQLQSQHLLRKRRVVQGPQGPVLQVDGASYLSFCSNDYLGLANHPELIAAALAGMAEFGIGASASALISGHSAAHEALEQQLAAFVNMPSALYFSNGYMANMGTIAALVGAGDTIFSDRLNHASLIDGARLSRAEFKVYPHSNTTALSHLLEKCKSPRKLVATDAVFSMDGDIAPLAELLSLCERYDAWLLVDDAHGFGVLGPQGRGSLQRGGLDSDRLLYMGTLGKAAGVAGAFVAANSNVIAWLLQRARTYMFTTSNPALLATAVSASLKLIAADEWRRTRLKELGNQLKQALHDLPWPLMPSETAIHPLIVGDNKTAQRLMQLLREQGIWVPSICPPTVPKGTARLRISLSALHTRTHVEQLARGLTQATAILGR
ncbi:MAG TPA: 8-amino-7-oxononanoate synthase [Herbaspirillum sp.]